VENITTVIFDLGRVLVRLNTDGERFGELMRSVGVEPGQAFRQFWLQGDVHRHMTGELSPQAFYDAARENFGLSTSYESFVEGWCDLFAPMPGMEELFGEVAGRYRVGILSDTDPLHWRAIRAMLPWLAAVERPTLSYEVGYLKPHPEMFAAAARNCGSAKEECLFIDDLTGNVDGARYFGMQALVFNGLEKLRRDLRQVKVL
jgi:haloacid dehalogenase superfamily, subfamily IA, variant 3 with third motif having DD or ED